MTSENQLPRESESGGEHYQTVAWRSHRTSRSALAHVIGMPAQIGIGSRAPNPPLPSQDLFPVKSPPLPSSRLSLLLSFHLTHRSPSEIARRPWPSPSLPPPAPSRQRLPPPLRRLPQCTQRWSPTPPCSRSSPSARPSLSSCECASLLSLSPPSLHLPIAPAFLTRRSDQPRVSSRRSLILFFWRRMTNSAVY